MHGQQNFNPLHTVQCIINSDDDINKVSQKSVPFLVMLLPFVRLYKLHPSSLNPINLTRISAGNAATLWF
jgi:hypothetical protein